MKNQIETLNGKLSETEAQLTELTGKLREAEEANRAMVNETFNKSLENTGLTQQIEQQKQQIQKMKDLYAEQQRMVNDLQRQLIEGAGRNAGSEAMAAQIKDIMQNMASLGNSQQLTDLSRSVESIMVAISTGAEKASADLAQLGATLKDTAQQAMAAGEAVNKSISQQAMTEARSIMDGGVSRIMQQMLADTQRIENDMIAAAELIAEAMGNAGRQVRRGAEEAKEDAAEGAQALEDVVQNIEQSQRRLNVAGEQMSRTVTGINLDGNRVRVQLDGNNNVTGYTETSAGDFARMERLAREYIQARQAYLTAVRSGTRELMAAAGAQMRNAENDYINEVRNAQNQTDQVQELIRRTDEAIDSLADRAGIARAENELKRLSGALREFKAAQADYGKAIDSGKVTRMNDAAARLAQARQVMDQGTTNADWMQHTIDQQTRLNALMDEYNRSRTISSTSANELTHLAAFTDLANKYVEARENYLKALRSGSETEADAANQAMQTAETAYNNALANVNRNAADFSKVIRDTSESIGRLTTQTDIVEANNALKSLSRALSEFKKAQKDYNDARKSGDSGRVQTAEDQLMAADALVRTRQNEAQQLNMTNVQQERLTSMVNEYQRALRGAGDERQRENALASASEKIYERIYRWVVNMLIMSQLRKIWGDMLKYVQEYYDSLNSIRVVTGDSAERIQQMSKQYHQIAEELKVSSLTISDAMEKIYRQGYDNEEDVLGIQRWSTIFGAITGSDTSAALETMTAALQNFRKDGESASELAERIADSWSYLGDTVATSAADVGTAISKVAGSASNVGVELEQVSAWVA